MMEAESLTYGKDYRYLPVYSFENGQWHEVAPGVSGFTVQIVNVVFVDQPASGAWVLVDAGMPGSAEKIISAAEARYGAASRPTSILLTHGHFDHVGAIVELIRHWNVPVYAHESEMPYLTGRRKYPDPDPTVEGGLVAKLSPWFPVEPIQLGDHVRALPRDGIVPGMTEWQWVHTPGHTPGHVSLFRERDSVLIAGDAFVTVKQDSLYKVLMQEEEISGPPRYLTPDWQTARHSVNKLARLQPFAAITGHGLPMNGERLLHGLDELARDFDRIALPDYGRYAKH